MDYAEARNYLDQVSKGGSVLGLDNMRELLNRLRNPQDRLKFIHLQEPMEKVLFWRIFLLSYRSGIPHRKIYFSGTSFLTGKKSRWMKK